MSYEFRLPDIGEGMAEGEIVKWLVSEGQEVKEDDIIAEVQTDKAAVEIPSPVNGKVVKLHAREGEVVNVGTVIITFETNQEVPPDASPQTVAEKEEDNVQFTIAEQALEESQEDSRQKRDTENLHQAKQPVEMVQTSEVLQVSPIQGRRKVLAAPAVRKLAREQGINISQVQGTGNHGQVTKEDLEKFVAERQAAPAQATAFGQATVGQLPATTSHPVQEMQQTEARPSSSRASVTLPLSSTTREKRVPLRGVRKAVAEAMVRAKYTAPHVTIMDEIEVDKLVALRQRLKPKGEEKGVKLTYLPFIVKALIATARAFPALNASLDDEAKEIVYKYDYHIGIATATEQGLMVPVVHEADRKSIWHIAKEIEELATKARERKITLEEMHGGTISITNIGSAGGMFFTPVINHPEVAILGVGKIAEKPVVHNHKVDVAPVLLLSLSFDHRVMDGELAQRAMNFLKELLADPDQLFMEV